MPIYDPLVDKSSIRHILCRHEQGAGHAAEGYAWATGKVGVCMATSGPGATNLVTPLADAKMDSVPIVAITGQVPTPVVGNDAFQEADITGITMPITKHNFLVKDPADIVHTVREAFHIASTGRPGPVLIDLPKDVLIASTTYKLARLDHAPRLQAHHQGQQPSGERSREADREGEASRAVRGRRRDQGRCAARSCSSWRPPATCRSSPP